MKNMRDRGIGENLQLCKETSDHLLVVGTTAIIRTLVLLCQNDPQHVMFTYTQSIMNKLSTSWWRNDPATDPIRTLPAPISTVDYEQEAFPSEEQLFADLGTYYEEQQAILMSIMMEQQERVSLEVKTFSPQSSCHADLQRQGDL